MGFLRNLCQRLAWHLRQGYLGRWHKLNRHSNWIVCFGLLRHSIWIVYFGLFRFGLLLLEYFLGDSSLLLVNSPNSLGVLVADAHHLSGFHYLHVSVQYQIKQLMSLLIWHMFVIFPNVEWKMKKRALLLLGIHEMLALVVNHILPLRNKALQVVNSIPIIHIISS